MSSVNGDVHESFCVINIILKTIIISIKRHTIYFNILWMKIPIINKGHKIGIILSIYFN